MANYYFLITAFPPLTVGIKPELSYKELQDLLALNLTARDLLQVKRLQRAVDLYNIKALWLGLPFDERGNYNSKDLEEQLLVSDLLPDYVVDFLERYESMEDRLRYFSSLYVSLYRDEQPHLKGFLLKYYQFEREVRLVLTALRAKRSGRDIIRELQFEDLGDPLVADIFAQKDAPDYNPPREYEDLKTRFMDNSTDPLQLNRSLLQYRFEKVEEMEEPQDFSINRVLAYMTRLGLVQSAYEQDLEKGKIVVEQLSQYG